MSKKKGVFKNVLNDEKEQIKKQKEDLKQQKEKLKEDVKKQKELEKKQKDDLKLQKELEKKQKEIAKQEKENLKKLKEEEIQQFKDNEDELRETMSKSLVSQLKSQALKIEYNPIFKIIKDDNQIINKIIHIADIHIRLLERHEEYNLVFEKFYEELKIIKLTNPNTIVCLCGDLLEKKDNLKPNTIIHTWNFLKNTSDIFPLFIIAGNHDIIEQNDDKIDSISSILRDRPINNIYYMMNTGVYIYNNIVFGVNSIIDKYILHKDELDEILIKNNYQKEKLIKVCLYHGTLNESFTNLGFKLLNDEKFKHYLTIDDFGDYDYILLGDIHKFQYLNDKKTVAYCSSMISQNFGETDNYHGFLEWDLINSNSTYHILKNVYAHHKIDIDELFDNSNTILSNDLIIDKLKDIDYGILELNYSDKYWSLNRSALTNQIHDIYPNINIKWKVINKSKLSNRIILNKIKTTEIINNQILNKKNEDTNDLNIIDESNDINNCEESKTNISDTYIYELIDMYMKEKYPKLNIDLSEAIKSKLRDIVVTSDNKNIEFANSDWKLLWLSFDNMYAYGYNNIFDFTKYSTNDIIGIFGPNGMGKSSILDIITFMLFSKSARSNSSSIPKDIINARSATSRGILIIESANVKYMIVKQCRRQGIVNNGSVKVEVTLYELKLKLKLKEDEEISNKNIFELFGQKYIKTSLTEEQRRNTDDVIKKIVGTYDNFLITSILLQGNTKAFKDMTNKDKKLYLYMILKINYFDNAFNEIDSKYKVLKKLLKEKETTFNSNKYSVSDIDQNINNIENNIIPNLNNQLSDIEQNIKIISSDIEQNINKLIPTNSNMKINSDEELTDYNNKKKLIKKELKIKQSEIDELELNINRNEKLIKELLLISNSDKIINNYNDYQEKIKEKQDKLLNEIDLLTKYKQTFKLIKTSYNKLSEIDSILTKNTNELSELNITKDKYDKKIELNEKLLSELSLINSKNKIINDNQLYKISNKKLDEELNNYKQEKSQLLSEIINTNNTNDIINNEIDELQSDIDDIIKYQNNKKIIKKLESEEKIKTEYNNLLESSTDFVYSSLSSLKNTNYNKSAFDESIDAILETLNIIFNRSSNKHSIINKYDEFNKFKIEYDEYLDQQINLYKKIDELTKEKNQNIKNDKIRKSIKMIDKNIEKLEINKSNDTEEFIELQKQLILENDYNKKINQFKLEQLNIIKKIDNLSNQNNTLIEEKQNINDNKKSLDEISIIDTQINNLRFELSNLDNKTSIIYIDYSNLKDEEKKRDIYHKEILINQNKIILEQRILTEITEKIKQIEEDIEIYMINRDTLIHNNNVNEEIINQKKIIKELNEKTKHLHNEIIKEKTELMKYQNNKLIYQTKYDELQQIKNDTKIYDYLSNITGSNGIPIYILDKRINEFTNMINTILKPFIDKYIKLQISDDGGIEILLFTNDDKMIYTIGGMESLMLDITFKIIIGNLSIMPKCNLLFIDESISVFDKKRLDNIDELFSFLKQYYRNVFLITHIEEVKYKMDSKLEIKSFNNFSLLRNIDDIIIIE